MSLNIQLQLLQLQLVQLLLPLSLPLLLKTTVLIITVTIILISTGSQRPRHMQGCAGGAARVRMAAHLCKLTPRGLNPTCYYLLFLLVAASFCWKLMRY